MQSPGSVWRRLRSRVDLGQDLLISMLKNSLPPTAALWVIQSTTLGQQFDTVGYLPIIVTILMVPSMPRIPYLRLLIFTIFLQCIMVCFVLLTGYCSSQARLHTTPTGGSLQDYNSSACVVSGVWLIFLIWALQTYRTYQPTRAKSVVLCTIFTEVSIVTSSHLPDMEAVMSFTLQLFEMFLLGYAFSAFTSLVVIPQSSRNVATSDIAKILDLSRKVTSLEKPFGHRDSSDTASHLENAAAVHITALSRTFAKFQIDMQDAKKDIGWSRFATSDLNEVIHHFRTLIIPLRGLFAADSVRTNLSSATRPSSPTSDDTIDFDIAREKRASWDRTFETLQGPLSDLCRLTEEALNHCQLSLGLCGNVQKSTVSHNGCIVQGSDSEEKMAQELAGGAQFVTYFEKQVDQQRSTLRLLLAEMKDLGFLSDSPEREIINKPATNHARSDGRQGRLLFILYVEHVYVSILEALLSLIQFCDRRESNSRAKLQLPGKRRLLKLLYRLTDHHHVEGDFDDVDSEIPPLAPQRSRKLEVVPVKVSLHAYVQQWAGHLDKLSRMIGSSQSFFGFRVACAVMSICIVAFLSQTQQWFFNHRALWAAVFIPFSMAPSSGEAKSMLLFRVLGSALSIVMSLINWYVVDGVPAGVIVIYFLLMFIQQYFLVKFPQWGSFWRPCVITHAIIIGYSLQVQHTHIPQPPATNTDAFPVYLIGPYRCLCTLVGVAVAYFWTIFPQANTAKSIMRRRLGQALFTLSEYHSCMHWAISTWASGPHGDISDKASVEHQLMKTRHRLFVKETAILTVIRDQHRYAGFDSRLNSNHREDMYVKIANEVDRIMSYFNVVILISAHFHTHLNTLSTKPSGAWESGVDDLLQVCKATSSQLAALIHILASSVTNDQPLPPFLVAPEPFVVAKKMKQLRPDLMDLRHVDEEGFKVFAVLEVSVIMTTKSLETILHMVRDMVGEVGVDVDMDIKKRD